MQTAILWVLQKTFFLHNLKLRKFLQNVQQLRTCRNRMVLVVNYGFKNLTQLYQVMT